MELLCENLEFMNLETKKETSNVIKWLESPPLNTSFLDLRDELSSWIVVDAKKSDIDGETHFCDPQILDNLLETGKLLADLSDEEWDCLRRRTNEFEGFAYKSQFVSRSAFKLANINALCNDLFVKPRFMNGIPIVRDDDLMIVADIGGGPGGFVDFLLSRKGWRAKVFGIAGAVETKYKPHHFCAETNSFHILYDTKRWGDITNPEMIDNYCQWIHKHTQNLGAHIVMADAAVQVSLARKTKEIVSKRLYLCCCLLALSVLRTDGIFVMKLFDMFTPFTVGLIYLMYQCFDYIGIVKPVASRPCSSERYLICKYKRCNTAVFQEHLHNLNEVFSELTDSDIAELVPINIMHNDIHFYNFIKNSNNDITNGRIRALKKMLLYRSYAEIDPNQAKFRFEYLQKFGLNREIQKIPLEISVEALSSDLLKGGNIENFVSHNVLSNNSCLKKCFGNRFNWSFTPIASKNSEYLTWFLSKGGLDVFMYSRRKKEWVEVPDIGLSLPSKTLVYGEIFLEQRDDARQIKSFGLHIIDGFFLGGVNIQEEPFLKRSTLCYKFVTAINDPNKFVEIKSGKRIRIARILSQRKYKIIELEKFMKTLNSNKRPINHKDTVIVYSEFIIGPTYYYKPHGLMFFNEGPLNSAGIKRRQLWKWNDPINDIKINEQNTNHNLCFKTINEYFTTPNVA